MFQGTIDVSHLQIQLLMLPMPDAINTAFATSFKVKKVTNFKTIDVTNATSERSFSFLSLVKT